MWSTPTTEMSSGTFLPSFVKGADHAEGHLVARHEHRGDAGDPPQDQAVAVAGGGRPVALQHRRDGQARSLQGVAPAGAAAGGVEPLPGPGDVPHALVPQVDQVTRHETAAQVVTATTSVAGVRDPSTVTVGTRRVSCSIRRS
ncbi:hypothetical protein SGRIM128S_01569 [Streptomyces griseomycini]